VSQLRRVTAAEFERMLDALADAWARRDYPAAAAWFAADVRYADPLRYAFDSQAALLAFFETDDGLPQRTVWHMRLFDEPTQRGAAEYTYEGTHRYHGVALIRVADGRITHWREYQHVDSRTREEFVASTAGL
jgi:ketosteroid isomerase-like protein